MPLSPASFGVELERRMKILLVLSGVGFGALVLRLFHLQVVQGSTYSELADRNRTQMIPLRAPRGFIWDSRGELLVDNTPSFSLLFSARSVSPEAQRDLEAALIKMLPKHETVIRRKISEARRTGKMVRILQGVPREAALALIERRINLPGLNVQAEPKRRTRYGTLASHVLGYVDEISPAELRFFNRERGDVYRPGDLIGKTGLERVYDAHLRGVDGGLQFEMDAAGHYIRTSAHIPSRSGADIVVSLDRQLQQAVEAAMDSLHPLSGAAVVLDPRTGAVLASASRPNFDPGDLVSYLGRPGNPLFNRAVQGVYPPGSVFKIVTAAAGLEGQWNVRRAIFCPGVYRLGSMEFGCWKTHLLQDFQGAMAWSCNIYFYNMGLRAGPDAIERLGRAFGLGEKTGIDLPSETSGLLPGREWKKTWRRSSWYEGDTLNFSIGQGAVLTTPLQVAVMLAAVASGGTVWKPYVVERVVEPRGRVLYRHAPQARREVHMSPASAESLQRSLESVVQSGTGRGVWRPDLVSGGKTGTAQNPRGEDHAWFACYAGRPKEPPSLVVAVIMEHGGHGSTSAVPVARAVINAAFPLPAKPAAPAAPVQLPSPPVPGTRVPGEGLAVPPIR